MQHQAFNRLKLALTIALVLKLPDFEQQFVVTTNASDVAVGAILEQDFGNGLQPVAFASRKLNEAGATQHSVGTSPVETLLSGTLRHNYSDGPRSALSSP